MFMWQELKGVFYFIELILKFDFFSTLLLIRRGFNQANMRSKVSLSYFLISSLKS